MIITAQGWDEMPAIRIVRVTTRGASDLALVCESDMRRGTHGWMDGWASARRHKHSLRLDLVNHHTRMNKDAHPNIYKLLRRKTTLKEETRRATGLRDIVTANILSV